MDFKLEKLIEELESHFGTLTPEANRNAVDFYDNYDEIRTSLTQGSIRIVTSSYQLSLKLKDPNFEKYKIPLGASTLINIPALISFFFSWKIGLTLVIISILLLVYSRFLKKKTAVDFSSKILGEIKSSNSTAGMFELIKFYIAGVIMLEGKRDVFTPRNPSDSLN